MSSPCMRGPALLGLVLTAGLWCTSCVTPFGPGYAVERQSVGLNYPSPTADHVRVRVDYHLENSGNRTLKSLDAMIPAPRSLVVRVNGHEVKATTANAPRRGSVLVTVPFDPPWQQKASRDIGMEYELALAPPSPGVSHPVQFEQAAEWFPELRRPEALFAEGVARGKQISVTVEVPQGYRVLATGHELGTSEVGGEVQHRYFVDTADFEPFAIIGRYQERQAPTASGTVVFWTLEPLADAPVQPAAEAIAATMKTYEKVFGPRERTESPVWIVETTELPGGPLPDPAGASFPSTALLNEATFALGIDSSKFLDMAAEELARTWFGWIIVPRRDAPSDRNLGQSLARYAAIVAAEERRGDAERGRRAAELVKDFDERRKTAPDKRLLDAEFTDSANLRQMLIDKGTMFELALEDAYGKDTVRHALAHMVSALRGKDTTKLKVTPTGAVNKAKGTEIPSAQFGMAVLRSVLEEEAHKPMGDFFRVWVEHRGVPEEFRTKYPLK